MQRLRFIGQYLKPWRSSIQRQDKDEIQGSLHCATDDKAVRCYGRDDVCFGLGWRADLYRMLWNFSYFVHTRRMVRIGVDESLSEELLRDFPREAEIVRIPRKPTGIVEVDFWILPFQRRDAAESFAHLRGVKVVQSMMAGVDWITPWLPKDVVLCDGQGIHDVSASEWVLTAILSSLKRFPVYRDLQLQQVWK